MRHLDPGQVLLAVEEDGEDGLQELSGEEDQVRSADFAANPANLSRPQCLGAAAAGHGEGEPGLDLQATGWRGLLKFQNLLPSTSGQSLDEAPFLARAASSGQPSPLNQSIAGLFQVLKLGLETFHGRTSLLSWERASQRLFEAPTLPLPRTT